VQAGRQALVDKRSKSTDGAECLLMSWSGLKSVFGSMVCWLQEEKIIRPLAGRHVSEVRRWFCRLRAVVGLAWYRCLPSAGRKYLDSGPPKRRTLYLPGTAGTTPKR
jgi:hypothetical protein